jgi:hypothetical protein
MIVPGRSSGRAGGDRDHDGADHGDHGESQPTHEQA